jgi:LmbE family N-acetylglucosaminyl deacetylase
MTHRLAGVFAHPDDDTFGIAGTCALHADDLELLVVFATSGEAGRIADAALATHQTLGRVREAEAASAYRVLGVDADLRFLGYGDGAVARVPRSELVARVADALAPFRPDVMVTFGPEGVTAHEDHIAVGVAATEAFGLVRERLGGSGPRRLLHVALADGDLERLAGELQRRGLDPPDPTEPFQPRGVPDDRIGVRVDCSSVVKRKLDALREHRTQAQDLEEIPQDLWPEFLSRETFAIAWPEPESGADPLGDVFQALPAA